MKKQAQWTCCALVVFLFLVGNPILTSGQNNTLDFNGTNAYVGVADAAVFDVTSLTVEAWVYTDNLTGSHCIFGKSNEEAVPASTGFDLETSGDSLYGSVWDGTGNRKYIVAGTFSTGTWQHVAMTWTSGGSLILYINGVEAGSQPSTFTGTIANSGPFKIGVFPWSMQYYWNGKIDEVRFWNVVRSQAQIEAGMYQELAGTESGLIAYYRFNESGGTTLNDATTNNNDGTLNNMAGTEWGPSAAFFGPKNCLFFNGVQNGNISPNISLDNPIFTVEFWMQMDGERVNYPSILDNRDADENINWYFLTVSNSLSGIFGIGNGTSQTEIQFNLNDLSWHHVAGVFNGSTAYLYLDGVLVDSASATMSLHHRAITIAKRPAWNVYYKGKIDEVRIWSDVRSETEIRENMCKTLVGNESNLVAYYSFDNSSGAILQDLTANANNATLYGGQWTASTAFNTWLNTTPTSTDWNSDENWSRGTAPDADTENVGIPDYVGDNGPHVDSSISIDVNNLVVCEDATLTYTNGSHTIHGNVYNIGTTNLEAGTDLTITGSLYILPLSTVNIEPLADMTVDKNINNMDLLGVKGKLNILSSENGTGSLIDNGTIDGDGTNTIERHIDGWSSSSHGWHFLSSPVANQAISPNFVDISGTISNQVDFYRWSEPLDLWVNIKNISGTYNRGSGEEFFSNDESPTFAPGKGYLAAYGSDFTKTFTGNLNNTNVSVIGLTKTADKTYSGWNLIGNPFPSALDWGVGSWSLSNVDANCQIWNEASASYTVVSSGGDIPAMNGFMVHASVNGASLALPTDARVHSSTNWYKNSQQYENGMVLRANDPQGQTAQTSIVRFNSEATPGYDTQFDSYFLAGYAPLFYSVSENENYALNTLPEQTEAQVIPMGFVKNGSTGFSIELTENGTESTVYLTDHKTNTTQNLTNNPIYTFTAEEGDGPDRFLLHFKAVGIDDPAINNANGFPIHCWNYQQTLTIGNPEQLPGEILVYAITGQTLLTAHLENVTKQTISHQLSPGMYVVQVRAEGKLKTQKIIVESTP